MKVLLFISLLFAITFASSICSGSVQSSYKNSRISTSWNGFDSKDNILRYEWAIVSSSLAIDNINGKGCDNNSGIRGYPDIFGWQNVGISKSANTFVKLSEGQEYFIVVRATSSSGNQFYANTGIITAVNSGPLEVMEEDIEESQILESNNKNSMEKTVISHDCPIDDEWRCNAAKVSVREKLEEFYGPPRYGVVAGFVPVAGVADDDDDDDDDDAPFGVGVVILIAIAITLFFYILALAIMLLTGVSKDGGEFKTNVRRHENTEEF